MFIEYETFLLNEKIEGIKYRYVDNVNTYKFIKELKSLRNNNNIKDFENIDDIISYLREQFAGLIKQFFVQEQRERETDLIKDINATASTLKELVDYIQKTNEGKKDELKEIIKTFHPIIGELKEMLGIPYKFYVEEFKDLKSLLESRGFKMVDKDLGEQGKYTFCRNKESGAYKLFINKSIFDNELRLKTYYPNEWDNSFLTLKEEDNSDDLPF